jgi:hypothetical protein
VLSVKASTTVNRWFGLWKDSRSALNVPVGAMLSSCVAPAAITVPSLSLPHVLTHFLQSSNIGAYANESPMNLAVKHAPRRLFTEVRRRGVLRSLAKRVSAF